MKSSITAQEVTEEILNQDYFKNLKNSEKILFILNNFGPQNFTSLVKLTKLSKSTVSKYVNSHKNHGLIERKKFSSKGSQELLKYQLTEEGRMKSLELFEKYDDDLILINKINQSISKMSKLIRFYESIFVEGLIIKQIIRIISRLGDRFFKLEQNKELFMSLFFMFYNSTNREYKFEINAFCDLYNIKKVRIEFYIDKIMSSDLGFYAFERGDDFFFFHSDDILGTTTLHLIKDKIIEELIHYNIEGEVTLEDLDEFVGETANRLEGMDLIWKDIKKEFELLIEKIFVKMAVDMGFPKEVLTQLVEKSKKFQEFDKVQLTNEGLFRIIEGSEDYEILNFLPSQTGGI